MCFTYIYSKRSFKRWVDCADQTLGLKVMAITSCCPEKNENNYARSFFLLLSLTIKTPWILSFLRLPFQTFEFQKYLHAPKERKLNLQHQWVPSWLYVHGVKGSENQRKTHLKPGQKPCNLKERKESKDKEEATRARKKKKLCNNPDLVSTSHEVLRTSGALL